MRTVRCSSRLLGEGVSAGWVSACQVGLSAQGLSACQEGCLSARGGVWQTPAVDRIPDTHLWKHYLSTTSFADSNNNYYVIVGGISDD